MSPDSESSTAKILTAFITTLGVIFAAILGVVGIMIQTEKPIRATQTAEARFNAKQTLLAATVFSHPSSTANSATLSPTPT